MPRKQVLLAVNRSYDEVNQHLEEVKEVVTAFADIAATIDTQDDPLPANLNADLAIVLGGDGTLLGQARQFVEAGEEWMIPLLGINFGRLGFLAEFTTHSLKKHAQVVFGDNPPVRQSNLLTASVNGGSKSIAVNDCVITAGPPFRMIELCIHIDGIPGPVLSGDGVIVSTPCGSTAYNVSAGGPIVSPSVDAMVITPLSPHSLAFRPIVVNSDTKLKIELRRANKGTTLVLDGQEQVELKEGNTVAISRHSKQVQFVVNPSMSYWRILLDKMRWAAPPTYRDRGA